MELLERYRGALIGVHVGDSVGAPYEKMFTARAIDMDIKARGGLHMFDYENPWGTSPNDRNGLMLPAGRPTDDSDQTADLCHSLIECNGLDTEHLRDSLANSVVRGVSRLWDGQATGAGGTTKSALGPGNVAPSNNIGTNGSLMRCAPMALWYGIDWKYRTHPDDDFRLINNAITKMSKVTHNHPHSIDACKIYTHKMFQMLKGNRGSLDSYQKNFFDPDDYVKSVDFDSFVEGRTKLRLGDKYDFPVDPGDWPARGTAEFSLYVALWSLMKSESFEHGIELAVRVGGDTDTYAAIAGGLLGAYYGYEAIPKQWRETILGHDQMIEYADKLYEMRVSQ